ncbi:hypothetical protein IW262DRAFT_1398883 [Armillaria fumosa]|nr:hypothetical protein IW262DRAFT_1398883 [Armillaria fumosa]
MWVPGWWYVALAPSRILPRNLPKAMGVTRSTTNGCFRRISGTRSWVRSLGCGERTSKNVLDLMRRCWKDEETDWMFPSFSPVSSQSSSPRSLFKRRRAFKLTTHKSRRHFCSSSSMSSMRWPTVVSSTTFLAQLSTETYAEVLCVTHEVANLIKAQFTEPPDKRLCLQPIVWAHLLQKLLPFSLESGLKTLFLMIPSFYGRADYRPPPLFLGGDCESYVVWI